VFKKSVVDVLIMIQAFKMNEKIKRNQRCKIKLSRMIKFGDKADSDND